MESVLTPRLRIIWALSPVARSAWPTSVRKNQLRTSTKSATKMPKTKSST